MKLGDTLNLRQNLESLRVGEGFAYVRELKLGDADAATKLIRKISSKVSLMGLGHSYTYQSFTALTSKSLLIVGVIATREK
jgi:hypothetical protein